MQGLSLIHIYAAPVIEYRQGAMEDADLADGSFDVVLSSLAFHYVADFGALVRKIARWLRPGGDFVFSCEHPVCTAEGSDVYKRQIANCDLARENDVPVCQDTGMAIVFAEVGQDVHLTGGAFEDAVTELCIRDRASAR